MNTFQQAEPVAHGKRNAPPHHTALHHTSPHLTSLHLTTPHHTRPHLTTPHHTRQHHTTPHHTTPHHAAPRHATPHTTQQTPHHSTPLHTTLHHTRQHNTTPRRAVFALQVGMVGKMTERRGVGVARPRIGFVWQRSMAREDTIWRKGGNEENEVAATDAAGHHSALNGTTQREVARRTGFRRTALPGAASATEGPLSSNHTCQEENNGAGMPCTGYWRVRGAVVLGQHPEPTLLKLLTLPLIPHISHISKHIYQTVVLACRWNSV